MKRFPSVLGPPLALLALLVLAAPSDAGSILSPGGGFRVDINPSGSLYDGVGVGFRRIADGYDPISPGIEHDGWGASLGAVGGRAAPFFDGDVNLVPFGPPVFGPNSATLSHTIGGVLRVTHAYTFAAENVLNVAVTLTNVSGLSGAALYRRIADWDIAPTIFSEIIDADALVPGITEHSFQGFQSGNPLDALGSLFGAGGGTAGPGDFGGAFTVDMGLLAPGGSSSFAFLYGLSNLGQSEAAFRAQLQALGAQYILLGQNTGDPQNFIAYGVLQLEIPEPTTLALCGLIGVGLVGYRLRRRKATVA